MSQADQGSLIKNTLDLQQVPAVSRVMFQFNNVANELISYELRSPIEWTDRYIDAFRHSGLTSASPAMANSNLVFGVGTQLGGEVDLSRNKLTLQIESAVNTAQTGAYVAFMYFMGVWEL
jgi:hypothetical protein